MIDDEMNASETSLDRVFNYGLAVPKQQNELKFREKLDQHVDGAGGEYKTHVDEDLMAMIGQAGQNLKQNVGYNNIAAEAETSQYAGLQVY